MLSGQSQKELTVNEAVLSTDILLHTAVQTVATTVPATPALGQCWLVGSGATGAFAGQVDRIAAWTEGGWRFIAPKDGTRAFDLAASAHRIYVAGAWRLIAAPAAPTGGTVIDTQSRTAISGIITALKSAGIFS